MQLKQKRENNMLQIVNDLICYIFDRIEQKSILNMIDVYKKLEGQVEKCASETKTIVGSFFPVKYS